MHTVRMTCSLLRRVAELVALALENAMTRAAFLEEKERLEMLLEVSTTLMSNLDVQQLFPAISDLIRKVVRQDYASIGTLRGSRTTVCESMRWIPRWRMNSSVPRRLCRSQSRLPERALLKGETKLCNRARSDRDWYLQS